MFNFFSKSYSQIREASCFTTDLLWKVWSQQTKDQNCSIQHPSFWRQKICKERCCRGPYQGIKILSFFSFYYDLVIHVLPFSKFFTMIDSINVISSKCEVLLAHRYILSIHTYCVASLFLDIQCCIQYRKMLFLGKVSSHNINPQSFLLSI